MSRRFQDDRGAAIVEFALVLPILVLLVVGITEFGRGYFLQTTISGAAREGARVMAVQNDPAAARSAAQSAAQPVALTAAQISVAPTTCTTDASNPTATATVTITYPLTFLTNLLGPSITLIGTGVLRCNG